MNPLAITLGDPAGIGAEIVFKALRELDLPVRVFGSRAFASPPDGIDFVDVGGSGAIEYGRIRDIPSSSPSARASSVTHTTTRCTSIRRRSAPCC